MVVVGYTNILRLVAFGVSSLYCNNVLATRSRFSSLFTSYAQSSPVHAHARAPDTHSPRHMQEAPPLHCAHHTPHTLSYLPVPLFSFSGGFLPFVVPFAQLWFLPSVFSRVRSLCLKGVDEKDRNAKENMLQTHLTKRL